MTTGRWITLIAIVVAALLVAFNFYYRYVQSPVWAAQATAEADAGQMSGLKEITDSYSYVWDEPVWVVKGKDDQGADTYVWLKKDSSITLKASDGRTKEEIKSQFLQQKPDADIAHMRLGLFGGEPVWEVFYSRKQAGDVNHFYDFYRFRDGSLIVMYKLPSQ
ncbi:cell wall elongation regulator TseB-like domain-containing protein [Paenibacillus glycinis]|uniref:Cell wall elongation regulator TseB-like domain-containing protein n=1 Tax=Paenibacillus glycinis TaxID=2697035 RepID=A0ABW9XJA1_9BACL|nr:DUF5590 domain-containing protein [Paenibacillus glycinis]NBD22542.1 hypothetical protein [Paenibacillus glycinis]